MTEEIITKAVENVDKMFPEIIVNGRDTRGRLIR